MNVADSAVRSPSVEAARAGDLVGSGCSTWSLCRPADLTETALEHFLVIRDEIGVIGVIVGGKAGMSLDISDDHGRGVFLIVGISARRATSGAAGNPAKR